MRIPAVLALAAATLPAQFKSTVPLVVAPTSVTDREGRFVDGLSAADLVLYDNNVPQQIRVDTLIHPISLVVVIQSGLKSVAVLDKLGRSGVLFSDLLSGETGETALLAFSDGARLIQDFTDDAGRLSVALRDLRARGNGAGLLDATLQALHMLAARPGERRRVILAIAEARDRSSQAPLSALLAEAQRQNTAIYWLSYSTFLTPFTNRPKTIWDRKTVEEKSRSHGGRYPYEEDEEVLPPEFVPGSLISLFTEAKHRSQPDAAALLTRATGGRGFRFARQRGLEGAIQAVGEEVHRQYIVNFQPKADTPGVFHALRVEVKGRPELQARTRAGYWTVP